MRMWSDDEIFQLFKSVEQTKESGKAIRLAFEVHAREFGRKPNSVRNFYYHEVDSLKEDFEKRKRLGIKLENHAKSHFVGFSENEEEKLVEEIDKMRLSGCSVRQACRKLSGGDLGLMTRFQNKYQNIKKSELKKSNIIKFQNVKRELSERDINSLFMGLVQLIKKTAEEDVENKLLDKKRSSEYLLKKAFCDLRKKDEQIFELQNKLEVLKNENKNLLKRLESEQKSQKLKKILKHSRPEQIMEV